MDTLTAIRLIVALADILGVDMYELAEKFSDAERCQELYDNLIAVSNAEEVA